CAAAAHAWRHASGSRVAPQPCRQVLADVTTLRAQSPRSPPQPSRKAPVQEPGGGAGGQSPMQSAWSLAQPSFAARHWSAHPRMHDPRFAGPALARQPRLHASFATRPAWRQAFLCMPQPAGQGCALTTLATTRVAAATNTPTTRSDFTTAAPGSRFWRIRCRTLARHHRDGNGVELDRPPPPDRRAEEGKQPRGGVLLQEQPVDRLYASRIGDRPRPHAKGVPVLAHDAGRHLQQVPVPVGLPALARLDDDLLVGDDEPDRLRVLLAGLATRRRELDRGRALDARERRRDLGQRRLVAKRDAD